MERSTTAGVALGLVNIYTPVARHLNRHVSRRAKSVQPKFSSGLNSRKTQRSKADDSRAQKWRSLFVHKFPGHQIVGLVEKTGSRATRFPIGSRVGIAWLHRTDGTGSYCRMGAGNLCDHPEFTGYTVDGGYAEYVVAQEQFVYAIPGNNRGLFRGSSPSTTCRSVLQTPQYRTRTRTSPESGSPTGTSVYWRGCVSTGAGRTRYMLSSKYSQLAAEGPSGFEPGSNGNHTSSELHL
jgi:hypothetical protein